MALLAKVRTGLSRDTHSTTLPANSVFVEHHRDVGTSDSHSRIPKGLRVQSRPWLKLGGRETQRPNQVDVGSLRLGIKAVACEELGQPRWRIGNVGEEGRFVIKASSQFCMASAVVFTAVVKSVPQCSKITCA
jgi:hypothetical protein